MWLGDAGERRGCVAKSAGARRAGRCADCNKRVAVLEEETISKPREVWRELKSTGVSTAMSTTPCQVSAQFKLAYRERWP